jgi:hypothetical protein
MRSESFFSIATGWSYFVHGLRQKEALLAAIIFYEGVNEEEGWKLRKCLNLALVPGCEILVLWEYPPSDDLNESPWKNNTFQSLMRYLKIDEVKFAFSVVESVPMTAESGNADVPREKFKRMAEILAPFLGMISKCDMKAWKARKLITTE